MFVFFVSRAYDRAALKGKRLANVTEDAVLERRKALLEISDLRFGWLRTLSTALLTVAVAIGGWYYPTFVSMAEQRQQHQQFLDEQLYQNLSNLVDPNAGKRLAAIDYLRDRYQDLPVGSPERGQIIAAFVHQLSIESDPVVDGELELLSQNMDPTALPDLVSANRRQLFTVARELGTVVAGLLEKSSMSYVDAVLQAIDNIDFSTMQYQPQRRVYLAYTEPLLRNLNAYCPFAVAIGSGHARILKTTELVNDTNVLNLEGISASDVYLSTVSQELLAVLKHQRAENGRRPPVDTSSPASRGIALAALVPVVEPGTTVKQLQQSSAILVATGAFIVNVLRQATPQSLDLEATALPNVDMSNVNLAGANLERSVILADLHKTNMALADLTGANLFYTFSGTTPIQFTGVNLTGTELPSLARFQFKGSNFWKAFVLDWELGAAANLLATTRDRRTAYDECREVAAARKGVCPWSP